MEPVHPGGAAVLNALGAGDSALVDRVPLWFHDPLLYVREAFEWNTGELDGEIGPEDWQADVLRAIGKDWDYGCECLRLAVASGHGIGKSALVAWIVLWAMSTRPHLNGVVTANTGTQLETKTWRSLAQWHNRAINQHWFNWTATRFYHVDYPETWFVAAIPWAKERSQAFAGQHDKDRVLIIYDEASAVDDAIWEVSEGATTDGGAMWFTFGNPTQNTGRFRECFGALHHRWHTWQIDAREVRRTNKNQIQQWIDDYGEDSDFVRIRVRGVFPRAGSTQFIDAETIQNARKREVEDDKRAPIVMGVDVARFGDDKSVLRFRAGRNGRLIAPQRFRGIDTMQLVGHVSAAIEKYGVTATFVDGGGVGGGVVDRLKQLGYMVIEVQAGATPRDPSKYSNKRAEMWDEMRQWLATGAIDNDNDLAADLGGVQYGFDRNNLLQLEKKDDMKKRLHTQGSPDDGDALALTFAQRVAHPDLQIARRRVPQVASAEHDEFNV